MEGISLSIQPSDLPIMLEIDSIQVVSMLKDDAVDRSAFCFISGRDKISAFPSYYLYYWY